jgi:uncharacterized protein YndB with AHSA1/START domain
MRWRCRERARPCVVHTIAAHGAPHYRPEPAMKITVERLVHTDPATAWTLYNSPDHIVRWNAASDDWHSPRSEVDLCEGGRFTTRMEAKDGSMGFDFEGTYTRVQPHTLIEYRMDDGREVSVQFEPAAGGVLVRTVFDAESEHPAEVQRDGWQSILDNFARYAEAQAGTP